MLTFFFSSRRRHTRSLRDWSSDVCSSDLCAGICAPADDLAGRCSGQGDNRHHRFRERGPGHDRRQEAVACGAADQADRKSTRLNSSHVEISYAVFCLKKKKKKKKHKVATG